ncbi:hypothetical protein B6V74_00005 [Thioclava sp. F42-5]|nr:hypothetical protein B6V74_00005 [Thioclava sp. F42-5]
MRPRKHTYKAGARGSLGDRSTRGRLDDGRRKHGGNATSFSHLLADGHLVDPESARDVARFIRPERALLRPGVLGMKFSHTEPFRYHRIPSTRLVDTAFAMQISSYRIEGAARRRAAHRIRGGELCAT